MTTEIDDARQRIHELTRMLAAVVPAYDKALSNRNELKYSSGRRRIFKQLDVIDASIESIQEQIKKYRVRLDAAKRAKSRKARNSVAQANSTINRQNRSAQDALERLTTRLYDAKQQRSKCEATLNGDEDWCLASQRYYSIRHQLLELVAELDVLEVARANRKQKYIDAAALSMSPADVWSDATSTSPREINLFYGGTDAPDGVGHGHVILVKIRTGVYTVRYHRKPVVDDLEELVA